MTTEIIYKTKYASLLQMQEAKLAHVTDELKEFTLDFSTQMLVILMEYDKAHLKNFGATSLSHSSLICVAPRIYDLFVTSSSV